MLQEHALPSLPIALQLDVALANAYFAFDDCLDLSLPVLKISSDLPHYCTAIQSRLH